MCGISINVDVCNYTLESDTLLENRESRMSSTEQSWQSQIMPTLKSLGVRHVVYVPDAGHASAIADAESDADIKAVVLTTEEEGIAYLYGAWLGGERGVLLMQSSGVGNCVNMLSLQSATAFPLLMLVTMRGDWAEFNPWQNPMGQATETVLKAMNVSTWRADSSADVIPLVQGAATMAFDGDSSCAVLLGQRLIGKKEW